MARLGLIAATIMVPILGVRWWTNERHKFSEEANLAFWFIFFVSVIVIILRWTGVMGKSPAQSTSLSPLQQDVKNLMRDMSTCPLFKSDSIGMDGKYQMELPSPNGCDLWFIPKYSNEIHLAYNDGLGKVKTFERNNSSRNEDMPWEEVQQSIIKQLA